MPISPEKRKTTSYCRVSLCLFISRILAKPVNFDSKVRTMTLENNIVLIINTLRYILENQSYVKRQEKQQREQQYIKTSLYTNYPTSHYSFMKYAENSRLICAEKRCSVHPSFLLVTTRTSTPTKNMLPYLQDIKPMWFTLQCRKKFPQTTLLIDLTPQQNHAELSSLARA